MQLNISAIDHDSAVVLSLGGIMSDEAIELVDAVQEQLSRGKKRILIDVANVTLIDSTGVSALVASFAKARNNGANIVLANPSPKMRELLSITKLITILKVYDSTADGFAALAKSDV